ncbi:hypothetical protein, conserved [Eimeria brunetti]|uniref:Uncharacterized protein n=1 Tax=Eimeria brunetti TaxID=51314 RepID=U6LIZ7_9EIME|nr:hypothetical protein, conserved [Eimeria brunetti]
MPCSSTDDGSWGGFLASSSVATEPGACPSVVSRHTNNSRRSHPVEQCKAGAPEAAACRAGCRSSSELTIDSNCNESPAVTGVAPDAPHVCPVIGASCSANPSAAPFTPPPPFNPMQLATAACARAAARDTNCEGNGSDCDSDLDFFTPLSSPLRELATPSIPVAAVAQGSTAAQNQQEQLSQEQQQLLPPRAFQETSGSSDHCAQLLYSSRQQQSTSTSSLPPAKECGLFLGRFPLRRRYLSADCGGSRLQQEQQLRPSAQAATAAAAAGLHLLAKTAANATGKGRLPLIHRVPRAPVQSRRCQGGPPLYHQQRHKFQWIQQHRQPLLQQEQQQQRQQQHALQREASDEDIRMPLVPPPASSSPLLASCRVAPPTVSSVPFQNEDDGAPTAAAADFSVAANPGEAAAVVAPGSSCSSNPVVQYEGEKTQLTPQSKLLPTACQQQQQREEQIVRQQLASHARQQQQQPREDSDGLLQCSKRRRFSVERNDFACALPTGQVGSLIPPNACIHATSNSEGGEVHRQQSQQHMESAARVEELDFSSHRKRKRGGECSARLLLMLQPNAAAADAALLDVLGTALTAEETRELRMQQQKEAEAAAAAAAAEEAAARERTAAAAAAEAAAARAKAAAEAQEAAARAKAHASETAMAAAAATSPRPTTEEPPNTLVQAGVVVPVAAHDVASGISLFGTGKCEPHQQLQPLLLQSRQPQLQQPREHQKRRQTQQPQLQLEHTHGDKLKGTAGNAPGLGDLGVVQGRPKLRIRRANGTPGAAASSTAAGPGISTAPQQAVDFQQRQQQQQPPFVTQNPSLHHQVPLQQQMDVQGSAFQPSHVQQHQQYAQQPQLQQQVQQQQPPADGLGLGLAEFGPTKIPDASDAGEACSSALCGASAEFIHAAIRLPSSLGEAEAGEAGEAACAVAKGVKKHEMK